MIHLALLLVSTFIVAIAASAALFGFLWLILLIASFLYSITLTIAQLLLWPLSILIRSIRKLRPWPSPTTLYPSPVPPPLQGVDWNAVKALYLQGLTPHAISLRTGIKPSTVRGKARYNGWRLSRDTALATLGHTLVGSLAQSHSTALAKASKRAQEAFSGEVHTQLAVLEQTPPKRLLDLANTPRREGRASVVQKLVSTAAKLYGWDANTQQSATLNLTQVNLTATPAPGAKVIDVPSE